jgi:hypothetical protein
VAAVAAEANNVDIYTILQIKVIKMVSVLLAARQFSPLRAANSQFWLCSGMHKLSLRATTSPKPEGCGMMQAA